MNIKIYSKKILTEQIYKLVKTIGSPIVINEYSPLILNKDNIPKDKPVIYAPNHRQTLDPFFIVLSSDDAIHWAALERFFTSKDSIFNNSKNPILCKITSLLFKGIGAVPISRENDNTKSIEDLNKYLKNNSCIGIFPEGTTNKDPEKVDLLPIKNGVIHFAKDNDAWIQPVSIVWIKDKEIKNKVIINYRKPFKVNNMSIDDAIDKWNSLVIEGLNENKTIINNLKTIKDTISDNRCKKLNLKIK